MLTTDSPARSSSSRVRRTIKRLGKKIIFSIEPRIEAASHVQGGPFFDPQMYPWARTLEERWTDIRAELDAVLEEREQIPFFHEIQTDQQRIAGDRKWRTFFLYAYGYRSRGNCQQAPVTDALVRAVPGMSTAFFSILEPGKHIPEHRGPYKGVLRYHLALKVPREAEKCRIRVGDVWRTWEEGRGMIFDDTYRHEVRNDTDEVRVVLFVDVLRPMRAPWSLLNRALIAGIGASPYVRDAMKNQIAWEQRTYGDRGGIERFAISAPAVPLLDA